MTFIWFLCSAACNQAQHWQMNSSSLCQTCWTRVSCQSCILPAAWQKENMCRCSCSTSENIWTICAHMKKNQILWNQHHETCECCLCLSRLSSRWSSWSVFSSMPAWYRACAVCENRDTNDLSSLTIIMHSSESKWTNISINYSWTRWFSFFMMSCVKTLWSSCQNWKSNCMCKMWMIHQIVELVLNCKIPTQVRFVSDWINSSI